MTVLLTIADLLLAFVLFWHSANSADRNGLLRAMLYAFAFAAMCFGAARFMILFGASQVDWQWMVDCGHVALIIFGALWVGRETARRIEMKGQPQ